MELKKCSNCKRKKKLSDFYSNHYSADGYSYQCKECVRKECKLYRKRNPLKVKQTNRKAYLNKREERIKKQGIYYRKNKQKVRTYQQQYKKNRPHYSREASLSKFGLKLEDFFIMLKQQKNKCAICKVPFKKHPEAHLDHCHATNQVRDLLCGRCNTAIGLVRESQIILTAMIQYLVQWQWQHRYN